MLTISKAADRSSKISNEDLLKSSSITKGLPSSGKFESNTSNSSTKLPSGPGGR